MTHPPQSPRSPKKTRRIQPKIVGHTAPSPRAPVAHGSLRAVTPAPQRPGVRAPAVRPPVGAPGMRGFPRGRTQAARPAGNSVARALREQAQAAPAPELIDGTDNNANKPGPRKPKRDTRRHLPARPSVTGRPTTPDEAPMNHAPAAERPATPPLRTTQARPIAESVHRAQTRHRPGLWQRDEPSRPRPSRVLAEMHAALADEAASAE